MLSWLWHRLATVAPIGPLAWASPYTVGSALKSKKKKKKKKKITIPILEFPGGFAVQDPVLSLLWHRFNPWPATLGMPKKKKKEYPYSYQKGNKGS